MAHCKYVIDLHICPESPENGIVVTTCGKLYPMPTSGDHRFIADDGQTYAVIPDSDYIVEITDAGEILCPTQ